MFLNKLFVAMMTVLPLQAFASGSILDNTSILDLKVDSSSVTVSVGYPGKEIAGICDLDIVASSYNPESSIADLIAALQIRSFGKEDRPVDIISRHSARIPLVSGTFVEFFEIQTKDGRSLAETIERTLGKFRKVVIMPRSC